MFFYEISATPVVRDETFIITPPCEWIRYAPVNIFCTLRESGTQFFCWIADGNDEINPLTEILINIIGCVMWDVNSQLFHDTDTHGVDMAWMSPSAENLKAISGQMTEEPFRHLRAARISGADKECFFLHSVYGRKLVYWIAESQPPYDFGFNSFYILFFYWLFLNFCICFYRTV